MILCSGVRYSITLGKQVLLLKPWSKKFCFVFDRFRSQRKSFSTIVLNDWTIVIGQLWIVTSCNFTIFLITFYRGKSIMWRYKNRQWFIIRPNCRIQAGIYNFVLGFNWESSCAHMAKVEIDYMLLRFPNAVMQSIGTTGTDVSPRLLLVTSWKAKIQSLIFL